MGSADEVQIVAVEELADHIRSEGEGDAAVVLSPALDVFVRVGPQQVAQQACREGEHDSGQTRPETQNTLVLPRQEVPSKTLRGCESCQALHPL